jgi:hypothetical protein
LERPLSIRVGIATGLAVVGDVIGDGSAKEEAAIGETLNLAARLQQEAPLGAVVVAPSTRALLGQIFELENLGHRELKGIEQSIPLWRVADERSIESRFAASQTHQQCQLIGRDEEIALATARWERAKAGEGQVLRLRAEPGIGKSRLVVKLRERLGRDAVASVLCHCLSGCHGVRLLQQVPAGEVNEHPLNRSVLLLKAFETAFKIQSAHVCPS